MNFEFINCGPLPSDIIFWRTFSQNVTYPLSLSSFDFNRNYFSIWRAIKNFISNTIIPVDVQDSRQAFVNKYLELGKGLSSSFQDFAIIVQDRLYVCVEDTKWSGFRKLRRPPYLIQQPKRMLHFENSTFEYFTLFYQC